MTTKKIISEDRGAEASEDYIPLCGFADEHVFLTTAGELGVVLEMQGTEYECLEPEDLEVCASRLESALGPFDEDYIINQYLFKMDGCYIPRRSIYPDLVERAVTERVNQLKSGQHISAYLVILYTRFRRAVSGWERAKEALFSRWSSSLMGASLEDDLSFARHTVTANARTLIEQMADVSPLRLLNRQEAFRFFRRLVNPDPVVADEGSLTGDLDLPRQVDSTELEVFPDHLRANGRYIMRLMTMKQHPQTTGANLLRVLTESESQCIVVIEWHRQSSAAMRKVFDRMKTHILWFSKLQIGEGMARQAAGKKEEESAPPPTKSQSTAASQIEEAESAMENDGTAFGRCSLSVLVFDDKPARLAESISKIKKCFSLLDMEAYSERLGLWRQYCALIPGNSRYNRRYMYLSVRNLAHFSLLFLPQRGHSRNENLNDEYLMALGTRQRTLYLANLHWGDSPHAFFCGVNGAGKSFTVNAMVTHAQKYNPWTLILDIGGSYRTITEQFGGSYLEMDPSKMGVTINPFCLPKTSKNVSFLYLFVRQLIESGEYKMTDADKRDLHDRVVAMYAVSAACRTLGTLYSTVRSNLRTHLAQWVRRDEYGRAGQYGAIFDNVEDTLSLARFQTCDFTGLDDVPEVVEPLLFYILHRSRSRVYDPANADTLKLTVADECWRLLMDSDHARKYLVTALRTWRKYKAAMWFITQQPEALIEAGVGSILAEAQTSVLLPNPRLNEELYTQMFKLNKSEVEIVKGLQPKREMLIRQPSLSKICVLNASEQEIALYASTPQKEREKRKTA